MPWTWVTAEAGKRLEYDEWGNVALDSNPGLSPFGSAAGINLLDAGGSGNLSQTIGDKSCRVPVGDRRNWNWEKVATCVLAVQAVKPELLWITRRRQTGAFSKRHDRLTHSHLYHPERAVRHRGWSLPWPMAPYNIEAYISRC